MRKVQMHSLPGRSCRIFLFVLSERVERKTATAPVTKVADGEFGEFGGEKEVYCVLSVFLKIDIMKKA